MTSHAKPIDLDDTRSVRAPIKVLVGIIGGAVVFTTGFMTLQAGVASAKADAALAIVREEQHEVRIDAQLKYLIDERKKDHDMLIRIDTNVEMLVKDKPK